MSAGLIALFIFSQVLLAGSQIFLKHGINLATQKPRRMSAAALQFLLWLCAMTLWFRMWLGFLEKMPLSKVLPWEGLSPVMILLGAAIFLREKVSREAWLGIGLISIGVVLVSIS